MLNCIVDKFEESYGRWRAKSKMEDSVTGKITTVKEHIGNSLFQNIACKEMFYIGFHSTFSEYVLQYNLSRE